MGQHRRIWQPLPPLRRYPRTMDHSVGRVGARRGVGRCRDASLHNRRRSGLRRSHAPGRQTALAQVRFEVNLMPTGRRIRLGWPGHRRQRGARCPRRCSRCASDQSFPASLTGPASGTARDALRPIRSTSRGVERRCCAVVDVLDHPSQGPPLWTTNYRAHLRQRDPTRGRSRKALHTGLIE